MPYTDMWAAQQEPKSEIEIKAIERLNAVTSMLHQVMKQLRKNGCDELYCEMVPGLNDWWARHGRDESRSLIKHHTLRW